MRKRTIVLDPIGAWPEWLVVVIEAPTGVLYQQQFGGTACRQGEIEGYLVPLSPGETLTTLRSIFEGELKGTGVSSRAFEWPANLYIRLTTAVESTQFWPANDGAPEQLSIDQSRVDDLDEAWIPVMTSDGPGVLLWENSD